LGDVEVHVEHWNANCMEMVGCQTAFSRALSQFYSSSPRERRLNSSLSSKKGQWILQLFYRERAQEGNAVAFLSGRCSLTPVLVLGLIVLSMLPTQVSAAEGYLRIVSVSVVPETVVTGKAFTVQVEVEWRSLLVFMVRPHPPPSAPHNPSVRVEICEGNDVATCQPLAFAPSESGEQVEPSGGKTYSIGLQAPPDLGIWHLVAIFEIMADQTGASLGALRRDGWYVISSRGFDPWYQFDVEVKPSETVLTSRVLFTESFESGKVDDPWKAEGVVLVADKSGAGHSTEYWSEEGHTGQFVALLGACHRDPSSCCQCGQFSLQREVAVTPGSDLTVTFWYRGWFPFGGRPRMALTFSISSFEPRTLDQVTINQEGLTETWQSITRSVSVPASITSVLLGYSGTGGCDIGGNFGRGYWDGFEVDDVSVVERTFLATQTTVQATTLVQTSAVLTAQTEIQTETTSSQADTSISLVSNLLQTNLPYLGAVLVAVLIVAVLLARKKTRTQATIDRVFCGQCGTQNPQSNEFCGRCGQRLERAT